MIPSAIETGRNIRRKFQGLAMCALLALFPVTACSPPEIEMAEGDPAPALWLIEDKDGHREGWLFGTIHALPDGVNWRTHALERALEQSGWLATEIEDVSPRELSTIFSTLAASSGEPPLLDRVEQTYRADLAKLLATAKMDSDDYTATETWAAALSLAQTLSDGDAANGVDRALIAQFDARLVLEGARNQLRIFDRLPEADQRDLLEAIVVESREAETSDAGDLAQLWLSGDMDALAKENSEGLLADPELRAALLTDRNDKWVKQIDAWLEREELITIAVGAAHLAGDDGLPELLRQRGYTVIRIQ